MILWLKTRLMKRKLDLIHAISILHTIRLYTHIKNIPYQSFMIWAFGDTWSFIPLNQLHEVWNDRHGTLGKVPEIKDLSSLIFTMVDWYIQIHKPV